MLDSVSRWFIVFSASPAGGPRCKPCARPARQAIGTLLTPERGGGGVLRGRCMHEEVKHKDGNNTAGKWGLPTRMLPVTVPIQLSCLKHVEKMLIARYVPMMRVTTLAKGTHVLNGNSIAFHQPLSMLLKVIQRVFNDTGLLFVVRGFCSKEDCRHISATTRIWRVCREFVRDTLVWLVANCPSYQNDITISDVNLQKLPVD